MSSSKLPRTSRRKSKDGSETDYDVNILSPHGQRNIGTRTQPTEHHLRKSGESHKMEWESSTGSTVSSSACKSGPSTDRFKLHIQKIEDIRTLTDYMAHAKLIYDQAYAKPRNSKLSTENTKSVLSKPDSMTKAYEGLSIPGTPQSKTLIQNPLIKAKTDEGRSNVGPSRPRTLFQNPLELPLTKRKIAEMFDQSEACKFCLTFTKSKRTDLKIKESQLDYFTTEIQKAYRDGEQVTFKLEAEPETIAEEMSAAITQSLKLTYLVSVSARSFGKLDQLGIALRGYFHEYKKDEENFHLSVDRLLQYIVQTVIQKCKQIGIN